jgi:hypothetical protein
MPKVKKKNKPVIKYYCFEEMNDWEGETWHFYIPVKGNEEAVVLLRENIEKVCKALDIEECSFIIHKETYAKKEIDIASKFDECTYMGGHNILKGRLEVPPFPDSVNERIDDYFDPFYKGGIRDMMRKK